MRHNGSLLLYPNLIGLFSVNKKGAAAGEASSFSRWRGPLNGIYSTINAAIMAKYQFKDYFAQRNVATSEYEWPPLALTRSSYHQGETTVFQKGYQHNVSGFLCEVYLLLTILIRADYSCRLAYLPSSNMTTPQPGQTPAFALP